MKKQIIILAVAGLLLWPVSILADTTTTPTLEISTTSVSSGKLGINYCASFQTNLGSSGNNWSISDGTLPAGLSLSMSGGCTSTDTSSTPKISGIPTAIGTSSFTLKVTSGAQTATKQFSLIIDPATASLNISLDSTSPAAKTLSPGDTNVPVLAFRIVNNYKRAIKFTNFSVALTQNSTVRPTDFSKIYWYDGTNVLGSSALGYLESNYGLASLQTEVSVDAQAFKVITVKADVSEKIPAGQKTAQFAMLEDLYALNSEGLIVSGFPFFANSQTILSTQPLAANKYPTGWLDSVSSDGYLYGWAYDPDHPDQALDIQVYFDSLSGAGHEPVNATANVERKDVDQVLSISGNHGFKIPVPKELQDGQQHVVNVYAVDVDDETGLSNVNLYGSGKKFTLGGTSSDRHARGAVVLDPAGTAFFLGAEIRYPFPSAEVFLSWGHKFSDLISASAGDLAMPVGPVAEMKK